MYSKFQMVMTNPRATQVSVMAHQMPSSFRGVAESRSASGTAQHIRYHAYRRRNAGFAQAVKDAGRRSFDTGKQLAYTQNPQIGNAHGQHIRLADEDLEDEFGKNDQQQGADQAPGQHQDGCGAIPGPNTVHFTGAEILPDKSVDRHGKAAGDHPGDAFHLAADFLHRHGSRAPGGNDPGNHQG